MRHPAHQFWADDVPVADALAALGITITGHQQITDAYLLALAVNHKGKLATLDKKLAGWAEAAGKGLCVEMI